MTLIKSLLLGSAAGIVAIASAQAADLPTKKGAPAAEYVRVCKMTLGGAPAMGFTLPGSDTCLKISGYISAQASFLNNYVDGQDAIGMYVRSNFALDTVSNTAAGPLVGHIDVNVQHGIGADYFPSNQYTNNIANLDNGYLQWAGLTAGQHGSFFDFIGSGPWDDIIDPDHTGTGILLFAYTATLGGGFSATLSAEQPEFADGAQGSFQTIAGGAGAGALWQGARSPDWVLAVDVAQNWGKLHLAGLAHDVDTYAPGIGVTPVSTWGWAFTAGAQFNIPGMAGSDIKVQYAYTDGATGYLGMFNSVGIYGNNTYSGFGNDGSNPVYSGFGYDVNANGNMVTGYSLAALADLQLNPQFKLLPEISYGSLTYSAGNTATDWVGGGTIEWKPVTNLVLDLDLLYSSGQNTVVYNTINYSGFNGKLRIERDF